MPLDHAADSTSSSRAASSTSPNALGHPVEAIDQSFGVQAACVRELVENGVEYDDPTPEQGVHTGSWQHGT